MPVEAAPRQHPVGYPDWFEVEQYTGRRGSAVEAAYAAEVEAQKTVCRIPVLGLPADLKEALLRRTACNLARRALPLGVQVSESGATPVGTYDPEVRRLERPHRKLKAF